MMHPLNITCPGDHEHFHLEGGSRAASSAVYPDGGCSRICDDGTLTLKESGGDWRASIAGSGTAIQGGRILTLPKSFRQLNLKSKITVLKEYAAATGFKEIRKKKY